MVGTRGAADGTDDSVEVAELKRKLATLQSEISSAKKAAFAMAKRGVFTPPTSWAVRP